MTEVMYMSGDEVENRFISAMNRGIQYVYDKTQSLKKFFGYAAEECGERGSNFFAILNPHAVHTPEAQHATAHTADHSDEKAHHSFGGWLDWRKNSDAQEGWAVRINDMMRRAGAAFSYFNLPSFFPKRPTARALHAPRLTHGANPEV